MAFQQFSGINAFIYYVPTLCQTLGQDYEMSLIMSGVFNMLQLAAVSVCFLIIDKVGRRPLAIFSGAGGCISWGIMAALVGVYSKVWQSHTDAGWAAVAMASLFILIYGCTYAPLGWAVPSNFNIGVVTPPMLDSWGFGAWLFLVETKSKTLEQMEEVFEENIAKEERDQVAFETSERVLVLGGKL
ncbi:MFS general substrate transporter [Colletotrichum caudatum]|nr:MFS general substrate transporter [Colletotrichum caudatum]